MICGKEFMVLEDNRTNAFRDVLQIPPHSKSNPEFQGRCKLKGKLMPESVVAILRDQGGQDELPADAAWRIDEKVIKFIKVSTTVCFGHVAASRSPVRSPERSSSREREVRFADSRSSCGQPVWTSRRAASFALIDV
jgi:hypothetical protein